MDKLACNYCDAVFPADHQHECDYEKMKVENKRMKDSLKTIYWTLPATNPQSWAFKEIAKKGLYGE